MQVDPTKNSQGALLSWIESSNSHGPSMLLMDGGVSTHLEELLENQARERQADSKAGFSHRSLWSSSLLLTEEGRETILQGHRDWLQAGSDIITTVTYQCHYGVVDTPLEISREEMTNLFQWGVKLAQLAIEKGNEERETYESKTGNENVQSVSSEPNSSIQDIDHRKRYVVASSGCYGAALADGSEYTGNYPNIDHTGLMEFHRQKANILIDQNPDGLAIETIPSIEECSAVCDVLRSFYFGSGGKTKQTSTTFWISFACKDGTMLNEGRPLSEALDVIHQMDPTGEIIRVLGINCFDGANLSSLLRIIIQHMIDTTKMALSRNQTIKRRAIAIYPNSGEAWDAVNEDWKEGSGCKDADVFASRLMEAISLVENEWNAYNKDGILGQHPKLILGGCCRTKPSTIFELRRLIDRHC